MISIKLDELSGPAPVGPIWGAGSDHVLCSASTSWPNMPAGQRADTTGPGRLSWSSFTAVPTVPAVQLLPRHTKVECIVQDLGVEVDDALLARRDHTRGTSHSS